jgi:hypothetical protein
VLFAVDGLQIEFARVGLTDATFNFSFLLSFHLARMAVSEGGSCRNLAAGLAVGFTWNIKYNGFLPIVLALAFVPGPAWPQAARRLAIIATIAVCCYLPWAWHVQSMPGGYAALLQHHQGYVLGLDAVPANWLRAGQSLAPISSAAGGIVVAVAMVAMAGVRRPAAALLAVSVLATTASGCAAVIWLVIGAIGASSILHHRWTGASMLAIMLVLPGLYAFYLRLWLPTESLLLLCSAGGASLIAERVRTASAANRHLIGALSALVAGCGALWFSGPAVSISPLPATAVGYRNAAEELGRWAANNNLRIRTFARPPLRFYLAVDAQADLLPPFSGEAFDPSVLQSNDVLAIDRATADSPGFRDTLQKHIGSSIRLVNTFHVEPSLVTKLDDFFPNELPASNESYSVKVLQRVR